MRKIFLTLLVLVVVSVTIHAEVYDDFSSGSLDLAKWAIMQDPEGQPLTEEHGIEHGTFHNQNINSPDRRTILHLIGHSFMPGDVLEYDVDYISASGNRAVVIFIDNGPLDRYTYENSMPYGGGSIGHNGEDFRAGNIFGTYHFKLEFFEDGIDLTVLRPDNTIYFEQFPLGSWEYGGSIHTLEPPYAVGIETWSNGDIHADYDNFVITRAPELPEFSNTGSLIALLGGLAIVFIMTKK